MGGNTYPSKGLRNVPRLVAARVMGRPDPIGTVSRLDKPTEKVRVAAFDGENADPANGRKHGSLRAYTPWGELSCSLVGESDYWLGTTMRRNFPRRVLKALRFLLIDPKA